MAAIIDLKLVAYGNTQKSGNSYSCQHGAGECQSDAMELCAQYKLSGDINSISTGDTSMAAWPFILCMEEADGNPNKGSSCWSSSMNANVTWTTISTCVDKEYNTVQAAGAAATPKHSYVPWVLVDGEVLENTNMLQKAICDAYTGTPPASCSHAQLEATADVERCYVDGN